VFANLSTAAQTGHFFVYQKDGPDYPPARYHYTNNVRITPIIMEADLGWSITTRATFEEEPEWYTGGNHGYDNEDRDMAAIFIARGPKFKRSTVIDPFFNIDVYNLMARILSLAPASNNGTAESQLIRQALIDS